MQYLLCCAGYVKTIILSITYTLMLTSQRWQNILYLNGILYLRMKLKHMRLIAEIIMLKKNLMFICIRYCSCIANVMWEKKMHLNVANIHFKGWEKWNWSWKWLIDSPSRSDSRFKKRITDFILTNCIFSHPILCFLVTTDI